MNPLSISQKKKQDKYLNDGYEWVVDIDIEQFFNKVNHDKLIQILREQVNEEELIASIIRNMKRHHLEEITEKKQWTMWQVLELEALERYKKANQKKYKKQFKDINAKIEMLIREANEKGYMDQEIEILEAINNGFKGFRRPSHTLQGEFFHLNERKLEALIKAAIDDMKNAQTAILRMANDKYRQIIYDAQVYANTGAGTYEQAVDMATKDMLSSGLNCVQYANGARHTLEDYADMAIRTASKRAYLQGEGTKRQEWGIHTVIVNKRGNPCPKCLPFCGKVLIDDVWSGGSSDGISNVTGLKYPLMSKAVAAGLYHPRCRDVHTTYFEGINTPPDDKYSKEELQQIADAYRNGQQSQYAERQAEKFGRLSRHSLDPENKKNYEKREKQWKSVAKGHDSGIIKSTNAKEVNDVHSVGKIDKDLYKCITEDIVTDEVIITDNQIQHILERHPDSYEKSMDNLKNALLDPDFIIEDKHKNTGLVIKRLKTEEGHSQIVLRICTSEDEPGYKNSIISSWEISDKRLQNYLRNKRILYKKE